MRSAIRTAVAVLLTASVVFGGIAACELLPPPPAEEVLASARTATDALESAEFDFEMQVEGPSGATITMNGTGSLVLPAAFEVSGTVTLPDGSSQRYQQRLVGGRTYVRPGLTQGFGWYEYPGALGGGTLPPSTVPMSPDEYFSYFEVFERAEDLGVQRIDGVDCRHLLLEIDEDALADALAATDASAAADGASAAQPEAATDPASIVRSSAMVVDVWIGVEDGLPYREIVQSRLTQPENLRVRAQIDFTGFDTGVEILVPDTVIPAPLPRGTP